jgi:hypothetical protein
MAKKVKKTAPTYQSPGWASEIDKRANKSKKAKVWDAKDHKLMELRKEIKDARTQCSATFKRLQEQLKDFCRRNPKKCRVPKKAEKPKTDSWEIDCPFPKDGYKHCKTKVSTYPSRRVTLITESIKTVKVPPKKGKVKSKGKGVADYGCYGGCHL